MNQFSDRIEINPKILGGKPIIKGTRIPIYVILRMLRGGAGFDQIIQEYPKISVEDIKAALDYSEYLVNHLDEEVVAIHEDK